MGDARLTPGDDDPPGAAALTSAVGEIGGPLALLVLALAFLVAYLIWRRWRNRHLTG